MSQEKFEAAKSPESEMYDYILENMKRIGEALRGHPELTIMATMNFVTVPEVGRIGWQQIGREIQVRTTQQLRPGSPMGVEIDGHFEIHRGECTLTNGENAFAITVPRVNDRGHEYFEISPDTSGEFLLETHGASPPGLDDLEMYAMFTARVLEDGLPLIAARHE